MSAFEPGGCRRTLILFLLPPISLIAGYFSAMWFVEKHQITTPMLIGKPVQTALMHASREGLSVRLLRTIAADDTQDGTVLAQIPQAGEQIKRNGVIFVTISQKNLLKQIPRLVGTYEQDLEQLLAISEIPFNLVRTQHQAPNGICFAQSPSEGERNAINHGVAYLSMGPDKRVLFPNLVGQTLASAKSNLPEDAVEFVVEKRHHDDPKADNDENSIIVEQYPLAGSIVDLGKLLHAYVKTQNMAGKSA